MSPETKANPKKVLTVKARASFVKVFPGQEETNDKGEKKFSLTLLFPKDVDLSALKAAAAAARKEKWGDNPPKGLKSPFRDGDEKEYDGYAGCIFVSARSKDQPGVIDADKSAITDPKRFYSGCYCRATLVAFAYDTGTNKGVSFALNNVQKLADGEPFSARTSAEDDFDAVGAATGSAKGAGPAGAGADDFDDF